jgi:transposase InsO family protein
MRRFAATQSTRHVERRGRSVYYTPDVDAALYDIWSAANEPCGENLHGLVKEYVGVLLRDNMWQHGDEATGKLCAMSVATMKVRVGTFFKTYHPTKSKGTTNPSSLHALIPTRRDGWTDAPVGTKQIDTVAHCGGSVAGDFVYTVNSTCVATVWGGRRAQWNKGQEATLESMQHIRADFPVPIVEWHPDSGSEFINWVCRDWCIHAGIKLTRSRPNKKNDNTFVEERNGHVVRKYLGTIRLDAKECVDALNELYDVLTPYLNHWSAVRRKLPDGTREKKALTPYVRMLARDEVSAAVKEKLRAEHAAMNPLVLKKEIDKRLQRVINLQKKHGTTLFVR